MSHHEQHDETLADEVGVLDEDGAPAQADAETLVAYGGEAPIPYEEVEDSAGDP
ncbi:MAG: hypothetical protein WCG47_26005 [Dermatophilaceae bacterium]